MVVETRERQRQERSLFDMAVEQFHTAAETMGLDDNMRRLLSVCQRQYTVNFPVQLDNGSLQMFEWHRVQHNIGRGRLHLLQSFLGIACQHHFVPMMV